MLHEVRDREPLLQDLHHRLAPDGRILLAEPKVHVRRSLFEAEVDAAEVDAAEAEGFEVVDRPGVAVSRAVVLRKR